MDKDMFRKWEHIVDGVDKTNIPVQFIKKLVVKLTGRRQRTINVSKLCKQGLLMAEVEQLVDIRLSALDYEFGGQIDHVEFILDVERVASEVAIESNRLLSGL